ncbi:MAG: DUF1553 domain-containing protein [Candidatus Hydrogenedens sp.]|nr:DUF1553 domain-containing protein [Candidatus Hydrogenedens sp.]
MLGRAALTVFTAFAFSGVSAAQAPTAEELEFFETKIRPVLVTHCYECHGANPERPKAGLNLTHRDGLLQHASGPVIVPGDPEASTLLTALRYQDPDLQMPPSGRLSDEIADDFERWIRMGAPDPRDTALDAAGIAAVTSWEAKLAQRMRWWSYRRITAPEPPATDDPAWAANPIDAFVFDKLRGAGLEPAPLAEPQVVLRRLAFVLTGLPPTEAELDRFQQDASRGLQKAVEAAADRMLASPRFGERWARHWMDWFRYAETHGSEGDPAIPFAWRYRDYLIRALNADVPYDDLVREQIAGDLLPNPRRNPELGILESPIGAAQFRFVLHGFSPTDALEEQVRVADNQIDVLSKALLATTVSCARCHDHKFDPVSQRDYYGLYGIMVNCRPATITVDTPVQAKRNQSLLHKQKAEIRAALADQWESDVEHLSERLTGDDPAVGQAIANATTLLDPLHAWQRLQGARDASFAHGWSDILADWQAAEAAMKQHRQIAYPHRWGLGTPEGNEWRRTGNGLQPEPSPAGSFAVAPAGERFLTGIYPAGIYSHLLSEKHSGLLASPRFKLEDKNIYVRFAGSGDARSRYVVQNYPRSGTIYPLTKLNEGQWRWQHWDVDYWKGDMAHIEISTAMDQAVEANTGSTRSWFGISDVVVTAKDQPAPRDEAPEFVQPFFASAVDVKDASSLVARYADSLRQCIAVWRADSMTNAQARYLNHFVSTGMLTNKLGTSERIDSAIKAYRALESEVPVPTRVPGLIETEPVDQPLFARGDHKKPGDLVPRGFIAAFDPEPFKTEDAGRLELAEAILSPETPMTARVIVNRLWHHVFGRGIVATTDDFGAMGAEPSHPELLDYLATRMRQEGWSIKGMIRSLVTSRTFQLSSAASASADERDPANALLSHAHVRRLEAEAIRDSMLMAAGRLELEPPEGSPDGHSDRRSIYVRVIRNDLEPFLTTFDAPAPVTAKGRRDDTNTPAHALTLMNDPFVRGLAASLADRVAEEKDLDSDSQRIDHVFRLALNRPPKEEELAALTDYLETARTRPRGAELDHSLEPRIDEMKKRAAELRGELEQRIAARAAEDASFASLPRRKQQETVGGDLLKKLSSDEKEQAYLESLAGDAQPWTELAHALFNLKEFIYLR